MNHLNSVALHITNICSHNCPMCYATNQTQIKRESDLDTLKKIAIELKKANVEEINLVGGDPCEYSHIEELLKYLNSLGFSLPILSNTHNYKNSSIERVTSYVSSLEGTIHGESAKIHDAFCGMEGAYDNLVSNLKLYNSIKDKNQNIGIVLNVMKHNYNHLYDSIYSLKEQNLDIDYVLVQRIGTYGRAEGKDNYKMALNQIISAFYDIDRINKELNIETRMVDAFPYCLIPEEYHQYLDRCDWGFGTAAIDMDGNLSRCAVCFKPLGNVLTENIADLWENSEELKKFRSKEYLTDICKKCDVLDKCGGGCAISCGTAKLETDQLVKSLKL